MSQNNLKKANWKMAKSERVDRKVSCKLSLEGKMSKESSLLYVDEHASTFRTCVCTVGLGTIISLSFAEFLRGEKMLGEISAFHFFSATFHVSRKGSFAAKRDNWSFFLGWSVGQFDFLRAVSMSHAIYTSSLNKFWNTMLLAIIVLLHHICLTNTNIWSTPWENLFMPYANNKGADQPVHPRLCYSLLR